MVHMVVVMRHVIGGLFFKGDLKDEDRKESNSWKYMVKYMAKYMVFVRATVWVLR